MKPRRDALTRVRHDLRSVVHAVVGYSNLLASDRYGPLGSEQKAFVEHVRTAAAQLEQLVEACVELSRPNEQASATRSEIALGALVPRLRHHLASHGLVCTVLAEHRLNAWPLAVDVELTERALLELAKVVTAEGAHACMLQAHEQEGTLRLELAVCPVTLAGELTSVDALENELSNRDFVRLKLAEVLLARQSMVMRVTAERDLVELTLR